ncbi:hypothetical protein [Brevibacillus sp. SIMBA_076]|uniref:hypothetical protein n=1 Tax=Brevibacillus sp. SIMBA_076 TaxID=3085814 RepID=UPI00397E0676
MAPRLPEPEPKRPAERARDSQPMTALISPTTASIVAQSRPGVNPFTTLPLVTSAEAIVGTSRNAQNNTNETSLIFIC